MSWTWVKLQSKVGEKKIPAALGTVCQFSWFNPCKVPRPPVSSPREGTMNAGPKAWLLREAFQVQKLLSAPTKRSCSHHCTGEPPLPCWQTHPAPCLLWLRTESLSVLLRSQLQDLRGSSLLRYHTCDAASSSSSLDSEEELWAVWVPPGFCREPAGRAEFLLLNHCCLGLSSPPQHRHCHQKAACLQRKGSALPGWRGGTPLQPLHIAHGITKGCPHPGSTESIFWRELTRFGGLLRCLLLVAVGGTAAV